MKRFVLTAALLFAGAFTAFAGDAAVFADLGFSEDGKTYIFGQYGKQDVTYQAWAEIYTVDIERNDYVKNEVFITKPSKDTLSFSGKKTFEMLKEKAEWKIQKYNAKPSQIDQLVYLRSDETKNVTDEIVFKDFEGSTEDFPVFYHIRLVPFFEGKGENVLSSYYIQLEKKDDENKLLYKRIVGNPDIKRKGISSYKIIKVLTDKSGKSLVFIIEKTLEDKTGTSIRYMVETVKF